MLGGELLLRGELGRHLGSELGRNLSRGELLLGCKLLGSELLRCELRLGLELLRELSWGGELWLLLG